MTPSSESEATGVFLLFWAPFAYFGALRQRKERRGGGGLVAGGPLQHLRRGLECASQMAFSFFLLKIIKIPKAQKILGNDD